MPALFNAVSGAELDRHLRSIARVVRLSGTSEEAEAFDYAESQLRSFGFRVERHESDALIGYPRRASLEIVGAASLAIAANGYSLSPGTGPDGVTADVVHAGAGQAADYEGLEARGKIVLTDGLAMPAKAIAAERAGALGQIHVNDEHIHEMCISPVWGTPTPETGGLLPTVPSVGIAGGDGERLKERLRQGPLRVRLVTEPFRAWVKIPTLTGDLPGTVEEDFVLFSGHVDSWHYGAMDNGTANATQLEVARLLAERRGELRRGVRIAFWSGHSHGRYAGSTWYADTFWHDLHERCACHVNVDSVGAIGATVLEDAPTMAETYGFARRVLAETTGASLDYRRISRSSDQSFWGHGVPTVFAALSEQARDDNSATGAALAQLLGGGGKSGGLGWWWHTTEDTLDKIDSDNFVRDAGVYAETLWQLCTLDRLPFDPAAAADEMSEAISRYHEEAQGTIDLFGTSELAAEMGTMIRRSADDRDAAAANELVTRLGRLLIPVNYTRLGPFEHDLALGSKPVPGLAEAGRLPTLDPSGDEVHFLRTKLVRERNRVEHALKAAVRLAEGG